MFFDWGGRSITWLVSLALLFGSCDVFARSIVLADFDDTILETRQSKHGTFKTNRILFRIEQRANVLQPVPSGPSEVLVSPIDYHNIRPYLGSDEGLPGFINRKSKLENGTTIHPGMYRLRSPQSFKYFFASEDGTNYLLEDFKAAEKRKPKGAWKGPFWDEMVLILSDERTAENFGIVTARGHSREEWEEFFEYLRDRKYIQHLPNLNLIHSVGSHEYAKYSLDWDISSAKVAVLKEIALALERVPLEPSDARIHPNGHAETQSHSIIFIDDNQRTLNLAISAMTEVIAGRKFPLKFSIFNTGLSRDLRESQRPQYAVMEQGGTFRPATISERVGEPPHLSNSEIMQRLGMPVKSCSKELVDE